jgi:MSHA biogenesis protein MshL
MMNNHYAVLRLGFALAVTVLLAGCQTTAGWKDSAAAEIDKAMHEAIASTSNEPVPAEISDALLPPMELTLPDGGTAPLGPRFDLTVNNAPARQVFMGLVEGTPYSMVVHPDVGGRLTLNLKDINVPEAVDAIRNAYGYAYKRDGNRFFILGRGMQTRLFAVNYLNLARTGLSRTRVASGELTASSGDGETRGVQSGGVELDTATSHDFWKELEATLTAIIGKEDGRKAVINPQSGLVVVKAMPDELQLVEEFLAATHETVNRQVILEAKIIEVELSERYQQGINWSQMGSVDSADVTASQLAGDALFNSGTSEILGAPFILDPASGLFSGIAATATSAFGGVFTLTAMSDSFSLLLELLKSQGDLQVLSSPRVATVNNQKAVIKVGAEEFFITDIDSEETTIVGGVGTSSVPSVEFTPFFSGVALDVTPHIDDQNNITLHIHPGVTEVVEETKSFIIGDEDFSVPLAVSAIQVSDNIVRAKSGQIIVIGGLMKEGVTDQNSRVPVLGDIPVVGAAFKQKKVTRIKKELVILLRPTIVNVGQDWADAVTESQDRIRNIRKTADKSSNKKKSR